MKTARPAIIRTMDYRVCKECGETKPLSGFPNVKGKNGKTYHRKVCKECRREYERDWKNNNADHVQKYRQSYYAANRESIVKKVKDWQEEHRDEKLEYQRQWYLENQERLLAKQRQWYEANQDKIAAYREKNRDRISERLKSWRKRNQAAVKAYQKHWRADNIEHVLEYATDYRRDKPEVKRASEARRRALKRGSEGSYNVVDIQELYELQLGQCVYCQCDLSDDFHVDHMIPLARGGDNTRSNIQLLCPNCNRKKHAKTHEEYLSYMAKQD